MPEMIDVQSSSLAAIGYDSDESKLSVRFTNGRTAVYSGVQQDVYQTLLGEHEANGSVGRVFNALVRSAGFDFEYEA